ncbi:hypothetical protein FRB94_010502 [Tulasnella sp. JGI-2019a]|nr:hypothetical protein FRB94_010502 [Tulasnella sp. JGI-2019a]
MSYAYLRDRESDVFDLNKHDYPLTKHERSNSTKSGQRTTDRIPGLVSPGPSPDPPYDTGSRRLVLFGLVLALVTGSTFIIIGIVIHITSTSFIILHLGQWTDVALGLCFNALVTVCTEATGYVHGTTLKWGLAKEGRLAFNANLRLFSATKGVFSVNGPVANAIFLISIVFSYAASSTIFLHSSILPNFLHKKVAPTKPMATPSSLVAFLPPIILGAMLVLQAVLSLIAFYNTRVPTWSSSPLDVTSALVYHGYVRHRPQRCMRSVSKIKDLPADPTRPLLRQPSPWSSHKTISRIVWLVWGTLVVWVGWIIVWESTQDVGNHDISLSRIDLGLLYLAAVQTVVTIALHCCELIVTLARDEVVWRMASTPAGARPAGNPLKVALGSWQSFVLLLTKPAVHWYFGISVGVTIDKGFDITSLAMFFPIVLFLVAVYVTVVATHRPRGPQPVAYGHVQTLADLVDEWSMIMYWGHKGDHGVGPRSICHAGTTDVRPLPPIRIEEPYA